MIVVKYIVDLISFDPQNVPIITFNFFISFLSESIKHAISKSCFEFDLRWVSWIMLFLYILSEIFRHLFKIYFNNY